jgi:hypothetical protein
MTIDGALPGFSRHRYGGDRDLQVHALKAAELLEGLDLDLEMLDAMREVANEIGL